MGTILGVSGSITHNSSVIITGTGFGSKSAPAPLIWDNCSGDDPLDLWSNGCPTTFHGETTEAYNLKYRTPAQLGRGVSLPHPHITKYLCGCHYSSVGDGSDVIIWKHNAVSNPCYTFISWYRRLDPNWDWGRQDQNFKDTAWADTLTAGPYSSNNYIAHYGATAYEHYTGIWDANIFSGYIVQLEHERLETKWVKTEWETYWANSGGWMKVWEDGILKMHFSGDTWTGAGPNCMSIEGFFREVNLNCWRYMADIYYDTCLSRVVLGNSGSYNSCTIREMQIPTAWSDNSISITLNRGAFTSSGTVYLYVIDSNGVISPAKAVTLGGEEYTPVESISIYSTPIKLLVSQVSRLTSKIAISASPITVGSTPVGAWTSPGHINHIADTIDVDTSMQFDIATSTIIPAEESVVVATDWEDNKGYSPWSFTASLNKLVDSYYGYWFKGVSAGSSPVWEYPL